MAGAALFAAPCAAWLAAAGAAGAALTQRGLLLLLRLLVQHCSKICFYAS
jgi:hypothetical protein